MALSHPSSISGERLSFAKVCTTIQAGGLALRYASESSGLGVGLGVGWVAYATHTPTHMGGHVHTLLFFNDPSKPTRLNS
jgi:hypothetical protein